MFKQGFVFVAGRKAAVSLLMALFSLPAIAASLPIDDDFESGKIKFGTYYTASGNPPTISTEEARSGSYSMKSYLNRATSPVSKRTEVSVKSPLTHMGEEWWYGFSIFLPKSFVPGSVWESLAQWHNTPNDWNELLARDNPPLFLATMKGDIPKGHWSVALAWDSDPVASDGSFKLDGSRTWDLGAWETDQWTDWVFRIRWSYGSDGILQIWKNGVMVVNYTGPNTYNDKIGPYFKVGIYKGWKDRKVPEDTVSERVVFHDDIRVGMGTDLYSAVAPPGSKGDPVSGQAKPKAPVSVVVE